MAWWLLVSSATWLVPGIVVTTLVKCTKNKRTSDDEEAKTFKSSKSTKSASDGVGGGAVGEARAARSANCKKSKEMHENLNVAPASTNSPSAVGVEITQGESARKNNKTGESQRKSKQVSIVAGVEVSKRATSAEWWSRRGESMAPPLDNNKKKMKNNGSKGKTATEDTQTPSRLQ